MAIGSETAVETPGIGNPETAESHVAAVWRPSKLSVIVVRIPHRLHMAVTPAVM